MAMSENTRKIFDYIKEHDGEDFTVEDIAAAVYPERDIKEAKKSVNGSLVSFQKKEYITREEVDVKLEDGTAARVKFIRMTDAGRTVDLDAAPASKAE